MTRKHFQIIADVVNRTAVGPLEKRQLAENFAAELIKENPRFDRERFFKACGV